MAAQVPRMSPPLSPSRIPVSPQWMPQPYSRSPSPLKTIQLHQLLVSTLHWDISQGVGAVPRDLRGALEDAATHPPVKGEISIVSHKYAWTIRVRRESGFISVRDVLEAVARDVNETVLTTEYEHLRSDPGMHSQVDETWKIRTGGKGNMPVIRFDYFRGRKLWGGLAQLENGPFLLTVA